MEQNNMLSEATTNVEIAAAEHEVPEKRMSRKMSRKATLRAKGIVVSDSDGENEDYGDEEEEHHGE